MGLFSALQTGITKFQGFADIAQTAAVKADKVVRKLNKENPSGIVVSDTLGGAPAGAKAAAANETGFNEDQGQATPLGLTGAIGTDRKNSGDQAKLFGINKNIALVSGAVVLILGAFFLTRGK